MLSRADCTAVSGGAEEIGCTQPTTFCVCFNGIKNVMEDHYPLIYLSIILKSYFARKRRLADGATKRKLAGT